MNDKIKNWLVIGVPKNWETAFSQPIPIWGLKPRYQAEFQSMNIGDFLWFYVTSPIGGVVGMGIVKDKYIDNTNLIWEEEWKKKKVIWPLRFRIQVLKVLPMTRWKTDRIRINDFRLFWQVGFQLLKEEHSLELFKRTKTIFGADFGAEEKKDIFAGGTIPQLPLTLKEKQALYIPTLEKQDLMINHKELQNKIAEIGKLQFYYTELEYPIELSDEKKNLDVIWKREIDGVPTFAFEVELSGMIEKAIDRLKFSFKRWNSRPRIIVPKKFIKKVYNTISIAGKEFSQQIKIYEPVQIINLWEKKQNLKSIEQKLEMY